MSNSEVDADVKRLLHDEYDFYMARMEADKISRDKDGRLLPEKVTVGSGDVKDHGMAYQNHGGPAF